MESDTIKEPISELEEPKPRNLFSRWAGIYFSPGEAFQEIGQAPRILLPIIVLVVLGLITGFILTRILDLEAMGANLMELQGQVPDAQRQRALPMMSLITTVQIYMLFLFQVVYALVIAGYIKLFSAVSGSANRFKAILSMTLFSMIGINVIHQALLVLIVYFKGSADMTVINLQFAVASNLNAVLSAILGDDALPKFLMNFCRSIDLFNIWLIALLAIGSAAVSRKLKTSTAAWWIAGAYVLISVIGSAFSGMVPGAM